MGSFPYQSKGVAIALIALHAQISNAEEPLPPEVGTTLEDAAFLTLVGDSITYGTTNDPSLPGDVSTECWRGECFAARLQAQLIDAHQAGQLPEIRVINIGIGGATSRDYDPTDFNEDDVHFELNGLFNFEDGRPLFYNIPPSRFALIYLGTNDAVGFFEPAGVVTPEEYEAHVYDMVRTMIRHKVKYPILVTPPIPEVWQDQSKGELMMEYAEAIRRICARFGRFRDDCLLDIQGAYPTGEWHEDAIHPTLAGHAWIADRIFEHIEEIAH